MAHLFGWEEAKPHSAEIASAGVCPWPPATLVGSPASLSTLKSAARGRLGAAIRHHPDQPELADEARQQLAGAVAEQYVKELVDGFPPLSDAQRGRLAAS
jgi:hypothetical protein